MGYLRLGAYSTFPGLEVQIIAKFPQMRSGIQPISDNLDSCSRQAIPEQYFNQW